MRQDKEGKKKTNSRNCWVGGEEEAVQESETELTETRAIFMLGGYSGSQEVRPTLDRTRNSRMKTLLRNMED